MPQYLLSIIQPQDGVPSPEVMEEIGRGLHRLNERIREEGAWVFTGGLYPAASATVVRADGDEVGMTDGPYVEAKEQIGGLWIVAAPDLDAALSYASEASKVTTLPIEVRPFVDREAY